MSNPQAGTSAYLKGHGNEADFLGFLHKSVRHRSLTLHFEPFRFWLRIRGYIRNRKTTRQVGYRMFKRKFPSSVSRRLPNTASRGVVFNYEYLREFEAKIGTARNVV